MSIPFRFAVPIAILVCGVTLVADGRDQDAQNSKTWSWPHVGFGGIMIGAGYSRFWGPGYGYDPSYGYPPWGFYDPFFYGPYFHPGFFNGFAYGPSMGQIKLKTGDKSAWVFLDGAMAGQAGKLKTMWLEPGAYNLEVRSGDRRFKRKIYVLSGKTLRITADPNRWEVRR